MPCYTITSIAFTQEYKNHEALKSALEGMGFTLNAAGVISRGYSVLGRVTGTKVTSNNRNIFREQDLSKAYTTEIVKQAAKKFNWKTKTKGNKIICERGF